MSKQLRLLAIGFVVLTLSVGVIPAVRADTTPPTQLGGHFSVAEPGYDSVPLIVGLADASGYFGSDPVYLAPKEQQVAGKISGIASNGTYTLTLPDKPTGRPFDITGRGKPNPDLLIFDVRLMSDVGKRQYMVPNEDNIASSLRVTIDFSIEGGRLLVWTANARQQFPSDVGPDKKLFTPDDPAMQLPSGWSLIDLDQHPFKVLEGAQPTVDLITTGAGDVVNYSSLSCADLIPTFLDRVQSVYPFTDLKHIDWAALRAKLIPASKTANNDADCQRLIRDFGNAVPDGHVDFSLPALGEEVGGGLGFSLAATSDNQVVVALVRPDSPADQAGIKPGAIITAWDGKPVVEALKNVVLQNANSSTSFGLMQLRLSMLPRGPLGSQVQVTYQNPGEKPAMVPLTRVPPQRFNAPGKATPQLQDNKLPSGLGYIRIRIFEDEQTLDNFDKTVDSLIKANVPGIIIDVRSNPGGLSQMSDAMASRFFEKPFIMGKEYTPDGRLGYLMQVDPRQPVYTGPVAVLVDVNTASAAELFAYTFSVSKRATIVGNTPSAGMAGTVSGGQYMLPGGAFIQVPTGGFDDANGKIAIEGQGVVPEVKVPVTVESLLSTKDDVLDAAVQALAVVSAK